MKSNYIAPLTLILLSLGISVYAGARLTPDIKQVAVLFPLGNSLNQNIALAHQANANIVRLGGFDQILIVEKKSDTSLQNLYKVGALAAFNPLILGDCITKSR